MTWTTSNTRLTKEAHHAFYGREWCLGLDHYNFLKKYLNGETRFLDIGCGAMRTGIHIARDVRSYIGVDGHKEALMAAKEYEIPMNHLKDKDIRLVHDTKFNHVEMRPVDIIFCFSVIQHLTPKEVQACINMIKRNSHDKTRIIVNNKHTLLDENFKQLRVDSHASELLNTQLTYITYTK